MASVVNDIEHAARTLGIQLQLVPADRPDDILRAFSTMASQGANAFIVLPSPMLFGEHRRIVELAANNRLPGMYQARAGFHNNPRALLNSYGARRLGLLNGEILLPRISSS